MKKTLVFFLFALVLHAHGQVGVEFPLLTGETLNEESVTLPEDTKGKFTFVAMAASEKAEEFMRGWYEPVYNHFIAKTGMFDDQFDVNVFFVPMFTGGQKIGKDKVMNHVRKESSSDELFPYVLFYEGTLSVYEEQLNMKKESLPYIFLLDPNGKVVYTTSGYFKQAKMDEIDEYLIE